MNTVWKINSQIACSPKLKMRGEGRKNDDGDIYQIVASQDCGK